MSVYALTPAKGGAKFAESTTQGPLAATQGLGGMTLQRISLFELATEFSMQFFDRPLINATGLKGRYDIRLDRTSVMAAVSAMMTEMQEQLGLDRKPQGTDGCSGSRSG